MAALDARMGRVLLVDEERGCLVPVADAGFPEGLPLRSEVALSSDLPLAAAARLRKGLFIESPEEQQREFPELV
jgi:hypothetical protein